jgi:hypothetical protein
MSDRMRFEYADSGEWFYITEHGRVVRVVYDDEPITLRDMLTRACIVDDTVKASLENIADHNEGR